MSKTVKLGKNEVVQVGEGKHGQGVRAGTAEIIRPVKGGFKIMPQVKPKINVYKDPDTKKLYGLGGNMKKVTVKKKAATGAVLTNVARKLPSTTSQSRTGNISAGLSGRRRSTPMRKTTVTPATPVTPVASSTSTPPTPATAPGPSKSEGWNNYSGSAGALRAQKDAAAARARGDSAGADRLDALSKTLLRQTAGMSRGGTLKKVVSKSRNSKR